MALPEDSVRATEALVAAGAKGILNLMMALAMECTGPDEPE